MRRWLVGLLGVVSASGIAFFATVFLQSGCYVQVQDCPDCACANDGGPGDGGGDADGDTFCEGPPEETAPQAYIPNYEAPGNYVTLDPGAALTLTAALSDEWEPPMECLLPITYQWQTSTGVTAEGEAPPPFSFTAPGYYSITMTAYNSQGTADLNPDVVYASIWNGTVFQDDFERAALDRDTVGWSYRVVDAIPDLPAAPDWEIVDREGGRWVHANWGVEGDGTYCQPGSQAMLSRLSATNARVSVVQARGNPQPGQPHYSDLILRFNFIRRGTTGPVVRFYRARVEEENEEGTGYCLCLDTFKIDGEDQGGVGLNGSTVNACGNRQCELPAGNSFHMAAEIQNSGTGVTITVEIRMNPTDAVPWHSATFTDETDPITEAGRFGFTQCWGETYFDDFRYERLD